MMCVWRNEKTLSRMAAACSLVLTAGVLHANVLQQQDYYKDYKFGPGSARIDAQWLSTGVFFNPVTGHYYEMYTTKASMNDWSSPGCAESHMAFVATRTFTDPNTGEVMQGYLATITSATENQWLLDTFASRNGSKDWDWSRSYYNPDANWYTDQKWGFYDGLMIGMYNRDGQWAWTTGEAVDYTNFRPGQDIPGAPTHNYYNYMYNWVAMYGDGTWGYRDETSIHGILVEYNPTGSGNPPVPEPASLAMLGIGMAGLMIRRV